MKSSLESLLKKTGRILTASALVFFPYISYGKERQKSIAYIFRPSLTENIDKDNESEEIYAVNALIQKSEGNFKTVYHIRTKDDPKFMKDPIETTYVILDERPVEIQYKDLNEDGNNDIVYYMELDQKESYEKGYRYERWYLQGNGEGGFGSATQKGGVDSY